MEGMEFISCIRFSIQLFMDEAFFTFEWEKRHHFPLRLAGSLAGYVLCSGLVFLLFFQYSREYAHCLYSILYEPFRPVSWRSGNLI